MQLVKLGIKLHNIRIGRLLRNHLMPKIYRLRILFPQDILKGKKLHCQRNIINDVFYTLIWRSSLYISILKTWDFLRKYVLQKTVCFFISPRYHSVVVTTQSWLRILILLFISCVYLASQLATQNFNFLTS